MKKILLIAILVFSTSVYAQVPSYVSPDGLAAWYSFDENTNDQCGNENHLVGSANYTSGHIYPSWAVTNFQLSDPLVCEEPGFIFGADSSFTISCWIRSNDTLSSGVIAKHWNQVTSSDFTWGLTKSSTRIGFLCAGGLSAWTSCLYEESVPVDTWLHIIASYDMGVMNLFVNNELVAFNNCTDTSTTSQLRFRIGHDPWNNSVLTDVDVDDMGIWKRNLSSSERTDLYECAVGIHNLSIENKISLYPNPSKGNIYIEIKDRAISFKEGEISIYNTYGECVYLGKLISEKMQIELGDKGKGIYFVKIQSGQTIITKKIVIQ